jgi:DNA-binding transcriptional LysR family regulator
VRFDLVDLKLFVHTVECGSITAGALRSHLALASASARLRGMEDLLGVPLLLRERHGVTPTEAGHSLTRHARALLLQAEKMRADLGAYAAGLKGQVRLLSNTAAISEFLPSVLAQFLAARPHVNVELEERTSADIVQALLDGMADIGIMADSVARDGLQTWPFRRDQLVVIAGAGHALDESTKAQGNVTLAEIADHEFIGLSGASALQQHIAQQAATLGKRLRYRLRMPGFEGVCAMVAGGAGIAIVSQSAARRHGSSLPLRQFALHEDWAQRQLLIAVRDIDNLPRHARDLVETLALQQTAN